MSEVSLSKIKQLINDGIKYISITVDTDKGSSFIKERINCVLLGITYKDYSSYSEPVFIGMQENKKIHYFPESYCDLLNVTICTAKGTISNFFAADLTTYEEAEDFLVRFLVVIGKKYPNLFVKESNFKIFKLGTVLNFYKNVIINKKITWFDTFIINSNPKSNFLPVKQPNNNIITDSRTTMSYTTKNKNKKTIPNATKVVGFIKRPSKKIANNTLEKTKKKVIQQFKKDNDSKINSNTHNIPITANNRIEDYENYPYCYS